MCDTLEGKVDGFYNIINRHLEEHSVFCKLSITDAQIDFLKKFTFMYREAICENCTIHETCREYNTYKENKEWRKYW